jgi:hypothetical protein
MQDRSAGRQVATHIQPTDTGRQIAGQELRGGSRGVLLGRSS